MRTIKKKGKKEFKGKPLQGIRFGKLLVIGFHGYHEFPSGSRAVFWKVLCDCGNIDIRRGCSLNQGLTQSCGCDFNERVSLGRRTHGHTVGNQVTGIYTSWAGMMDRCYREKATHFRIYGGRGIKVCEQWHSFHGFVKDMGPTWEKGLEIDRFPNMNGNYEPGNVRWATDIQQARNTRLVKFIEHDGQKLGIGEWSERTGIPRGTIGKRLKKGLSPSAILSTDYGQWHTRKKLPFVPKYFRK